MSNLSLQREISEAIQAGNEALRCLENAKDYLDSAGNWGLLDIFGGGLLTTFVKHSKMNQANEQIQAARTALISFQRELHDVQQLGDLKVETGDLLGFADYFFDGLLADLLVQSRINNAKNQIDNAIQRVKYILAQLRGIYTD